MVFQDGLMNFVIHCSSAMLECDILIALSHDKTEEPVTRFLVDFSADHEGTTTVNLQHENI